LYAERNLAAGRDVVAIGIAGGVVKIVALAGAGAILVIAINEAIAIIVYAVVAIFDGRLGEKKKRKMKEGKKENGKEGCISPQHWVFLYAHGELG